MADIIKTDIRDVPIEEVAAKAAQLAISGVGINKQVQLLSEEFKYHFTRSQVERLRKRDVYIRVRKEYSDNIVKKNVAELREGAANLVPKALKALEQALDDGNIQAVPHVMKILGVENVEPENKQAQVMNIIMPGAKNIKDVGEQ